MAYDFDKWMMNERASVRRTAWTPLGLAAAMTASGIIALVEVFRTGPDEGGLPNIVILLLPVLIAGCLSPFARDAWVGPRVSLFDEFEQATIHRATSRAFGVVVSVVAMLFLWFWAASNSGWPMPRTPHDWSTLGFAFVGIAFALPILFAELMVPIPPESDPDDQD